MVVSTDTVDLRERLHELADRATELSRSMSARAALQRLIDALPMAAFVADSHGRFVVLNTKAADLTGYSVVELRRLSVWQITPGVHEHEAETLWRAFLSKGEQYGEYQLLGRAGRIVNARYAALTDILPGFHASLLQRVEDH
jgi:PAS domain S-box-containing protein